MASRSAVGPSRSRPTPCSDAPALDAVDADLLDGYGVPRFNARHYRAAVAVRQKVGALVGRSEVQARDIFDLNLLLARPGVQPAGDLAPMAAQAIERAMEVSYDQYSSHVVAYLLPEHAALYDSRAAWEAMQLRVVEFLEASRA